MTTTQEAIDTRYASRKWKLAIFCALLLVLARAMGWTDGAQFTDGIEWVVGLYMVGNVTRAAVDKINIGSGAP